MRCGTKKKSQLFRSAAQNLENLRAKTERRRLFECFEHFPIRDNGYEYFRDRKESDRFFYANGKD